jgi:hypothetical protein
MKKHNINDLQSIFSQKLMMGEKSGYIQPTGYICPFTREDCVHLDSLSMVQTMNCNQCAYFKHKQRKDKVLNFSCLNYGLAVKISTN